MRIARIKKEIPRKKRDDDALISLAKRRYKRVKNAAAIVACPEGKLGLRMM
jgi:hypothetical protein